MSKTHYILRIKSQRTKSACWRSLKCQCWKSTVCLLLLNLLGCEVNWGVLVWGWCCKTGVCVCLWKTDEYSLMSLAHSHFFTSQSVPPSFRYTTGIQHSFIEAIKRSDSNTHAQPSRTKAAELRRSDAWRNRTQQTQPFSAAYVEGCEGCFYVTRHLRALGTQ